MELAVEVKNFAVCLSPTVMDEEMAKSYTA